MASQQVALDESFGSLARRPTFDAYALARHLGRRHEQLFELPPGGRFPRS